MVVSERIGQLFLEHDGGRDRLEYTEYGAGPAWVVLLPAPLVPRRMHQRLARTLAEQGLHVLTLDPLGHGRSDRPADPHVHATTAWAEQVLALLDHVGADAAVVGGTSLGANVALEVAVLAPQRVRGLLLEAPVLHGSLELGLAAAAPLLLLARHVPWAIDGVRRLTRPVPRGLVPFWAGIGLDALDQRPAPVAALMHGVLFGPVAPPAARRRRITVPALVVGHRGDPLHRASDAELLAAELADATLEVARSPWEWRARPRRLDEAAAALALRAWQRPARRRAGG
ncbi:alpha/beta fold hydrolase [Nocardioides sp. zg-DK7169]|uniref:alpha/beta fold hydrolase n=1 Tax=Nocardioides sp. zg-DK7169 TaxID=2736600 RepID=UPI00155366CA|nr:alpha/beta fold hydrolase [Nocardioides sp. zg-DK7169]NPC98325.1 alpha/beta fold hydrolase [Nocardioides sp. zg-DK7169]